jgi:signal transduction histidine kinase
VIQLKECSLEETIDGKPLQALIEILERVKAKKRDYERYSFSQTEHNALLTFFDLAQEFDDIEDFYHLCIAIPKGFFGLESRLYLIEPKSNTLLLTARTEDQVYELNTPPPDTLKPSESPYYTDKGSLVLTIRGKKFLIDQLPFQTTDDILGLLELYPMHDYDMHSELLFAKYANRIGYNIHNKFLAVKNIEHLKFIKNLVADIEHNVIVPNMIYKLFLRRLRGKIMKNVEIENQFSEYFMQKEEQTAKFESLLREFNEVNQGLTGELENIEKHYKNMSLFLETLLRRSHFDHGKLTLRTKACNMKRDLVQPQLERFMERFQNAGIAIDDRLSGIPDEEIISVVDIGLMAQVYANLFSNALKYTQEIVTINGEKKKYIAYGRETIRNFFGLGKDGIKYNVFSTGPHIPPDEREKIFEEGYRSADTLSKPGTGHGLTFIKNAIEIHGGVVGCEATQYGNNFYFILPGTN